MTPMIETQHVSPMALSRRGFVGGLMGAGAMALLPHRALAEILADEALYPRVAALVHAYADTGRLAGVVTLIGRGAAQAVYARGVQTLGDPHPAGPDSLYRAYSMTKPITGMAAMMLIDEGKLGLDQPIADILPKFARMQVQVTPDGSITDLKPAQTQITVRHLLTHTAGLGYSIIQKGPLRKAYEEAALLPGAVSRNTLPGLPAVKPLPSLAAFADKLAEMPLVYEPGTKWSYSVALDLLGRVIEVVAGKPFDTFLAERIFGPCGMASSGFRVAPENAARLTTDYTIVNGKLVPIDPAATSIYLDPPAYPYGGAGLVTSPRDYDRFLAMLLNYGTIDGQRVMSERAVRMGTGDLLPPALAGGTDVFGEKSAFGAGGRVSLGAAAGTFGWGGLAGTVGFISYRAGVRAGLWVQYLPSGLLPIGEEFAKAVREDLIAAAMAGKKAA